MLLNNFIPQLPTGYILKYNYIINKCRTKYKFFCLPFMFATMTSLKVFLGVKIIVFNSFVTRIPIHPCCWWPIVHLGYACTFGTIYNFMTATRSQNYRKAVSAKQRTIKLIKLFKLLQDSKYFILLHSLCLGTQLTWEGRPVFVVVRGNRCIYNVSLFMFCSVIHCQSLHCSSPDLL